MINDEQRGDGLPAVSDIVTVAGTGEVNLHTCRSSTTNPAKAMAAPRSSSIHGLRAGIALACRSGTDDVLELLPGVRSVVPLAETVAVFTSVPGEATAGGVMVSVMGGAAPTASVGRVSEVPSLIVEVSQAAVDPVEPPKRMHCSSAPSDCGRRVGCRRTTALVCSPPPGSRRLR